MKKYLRIGEYFDKYHLGSDERRILGQYFMWKYKERTAASVLCVGSPGEEQLPLQRHVKNYYIVEDVTHYKEQLLALSKMPGFEDIAADMRVSFDAVVLPHVLPLRPGTAPGREKIIEAAWRLVSTNGRLFVVVLDEGVSEWGDLLRSSGLIAPDEIDWYALLYEYLSHVGKVDVHRVTTLFTTNMRQRAIHVMKTLYAQNDSGLLQKFLDAPRVGQLLDAMHRKNGVYRFPFQQIVLEVSRS